LVRGISGSIYYDGQGAIFTTMRALHAAMGLERWELGDEERPLHLDI
jgi:hypothetical protein